MINIVEKQNSVVLIDSNDNTKYCEIEKRRFEETIDNNLSDWILHLVDKTWMIDNTDVLYQLAATICKEYPKNSIDWHTTFFVVEKGNYLDLLADSLLPKEKNGFKSVINRIIFNRDQSTQENHTIIETITSQKLAAYHLN